jgi:hypothetical protein
MNRIPVESSSVKAIGYEPDTETLEVEFTSGGVYQFAGVSQFAYDSFMAAESKGHHFAVYVRACFESIRLHDAQCSAGGNCWCTKQRRDVSRAKEIENAETQDLTQQLKESVRRTTKRRATV